MTSFASTVNQILKQCKNQFLKCHKDVSPYFYTFCYTFFVQIQISIWHYTPYEEFPLKCLIVQVCQQCVFSVYIFFLRSFYFTFVSQRKFCLIWNSRLTTFSFKTLKVSLCFLLAFIISSKKSAEFLYLFFCMQFFFHFYIQDYSSFRCLSFEQLTMKCLGVCVYVSLFYLLFSELLASMVCYISLILENSQPLSLQVASPVFFSLFLLGL